MGFSKRSFFKSFPILLISIVSTSMVFSCAQNGSNDAQSSSSFTATTAKYAVVATQAADYSSGAHSVLGYSSPRPAVNDLLPTISDLGISSYGQYFYRLERFGANNVTKFSIDDPSTPIWQFSTEGTESNSNPYNIVFVSDTKAYLIRYGSPKVWIINPSAQTEAEFKTGELDLSSYDDGDGSPEAASGFVGGGKFYLALQRLDMNNWGATTNPAYIAVFDTTTDAEIETSQGDPGLKGIKLDVRNPGGPTGRIKYYDGYLYIPGADDMFGGSANGGIQRVNVTTYVPDHNIIQAGQHITNVEVVSSTKGYFIQYDPIFVAPWGKTYLMSFNPQTGVVNSGNVANIGDNDDRNINYMTKDDDAFLWLSDASLTNPGIYIVDTTTDTVQEGPISTNLNPIQITFCEK
jgi:hypothetical protein